MANSLVNLIVKELKELIRDPKILIGVILMPLILFPIMGSAINVSRESVSRAIITASFAVYDEDQGPVAAEFIRFISLNATVIPIEANSITEALLQIQKSNVSTLIHIQQGFSENITLGRKGVVKIFANLKSATLSETGKTEIVNTFLNIYSYYLSINKINQLLLEAQEIADPDAIRTPISVAYASIIRDRVLEVPPQSIFSLLVTQSILLPILVMIMVMFAIQMAATSIAIEKEQKTLETLMTLPVGRMTILTGKLAGSIIVAIGGAIAYMIGFGFYMNSAFSFAPQVPTINLGDANIGIQPVGYLLIAVTMFVTLVSGLALAICIAVFVDSVRSAQSLTGVLIVPIIVPAIILMFSDLETLPNTVQWILLLIPYTHSILASKAAIMGEYFIVLRSIAYITVFTVIVLYLAARIFSTEKILTATFKSLRFRGFKQRKEKSG
ncbi:ABC transporter permease [Candidatus Bathyarchaeota archaeon]|nr:ABC transporter permease [Candidatus Bathyarchaeota archaeon]